MSGGVADVERELRLMRREVVAFSVMVGAGETYVPAFALAMGLGDVRAGLLATLPILAGGVFQLLTPAGVVRLGSYRRWVVGCALLQALAFAPLVVGALLGRIAALWVFAAAVAYWAFGMATSPAWNAWVGTVVPAERRARFFARRARWGQVALLAGVLGGGAFLEWARGPSAAFAALFVLAGGARLLSARLLARQSEPATLVDSHELDSPWRAWRDLARGGTRRLLFYLLAVQAAVHVAAPYFTPYMLGPLGLSYGGYTVLTAAAFVARIAVLPLLGRFSQARGHRALLWSGALGVTPLPALWLVSDDFFYLLGVQLLAGASWAAFELATVLAFFEELEPKRRASVLALFNLANAAAMGVGCVAGGWLLAHAGGGGVYAVVLLASTALRLASLPFLRAVPPLARPPLPAPERVLALRPSLGAVQRPVTSALPEAPSAEAKPAGPHGQGS
jgi:MFS family permease